MGKVRKIVSVVLFTTLASTYSTLSSPPKIAPSGWIAPSIVCKAVAIYQESRGEPIAGQKAVLDVINERVRRSGKSACQVVKAAHQFSWYHGQKLVADENMLTQFEEVSKMRSVCEGCTHFHADYVHPPWSRKMTKVKKIGKHIFFKEKQND